MTEIVDTNTKTLKEVFSSNYEVPKFQRNYSWKEIQWEELWDDINELISYKEDKVEQHYMGYLVLQGDKNSTKFTIVDGQQRITTLSLLILGAIHKLNELGSIERVEDLMGKYIGEKESVHLKLTNKIALNSRNNDIFSNKLTSLDHKLEDLVKLKQRYVSNKLLVRAAKYFKEKISDISEDDEVKISQIIDLISNNIIFTVIKVSDQSNAYKLFQALNDRGVQLSVDDLLKNHLFTAIDKTNKLTIQDQDKLEKDWFEVVNNVGETKIPRFLRADWNRQHGEVVKIKNLYKAIRDEKIDEKQAVSYLNDLKQQSLIYNAIKNPNSTYWKENYTSIKEEIKECLNCIKAFNVVTPDGLILTILEKYKNNNEKLKQIFNVINVITIRYNAICNKQANIQEIAYYKLSNLIYSNNEYKLKEILFNMYPSDEEFHNSFLNYETSSNRRAKHILAYIEKFNNPNGMLDPDLASLEHVLPNSPNDSWKRIISEEDIESCTEKLGNMTIITGSMNSKIGNKSFNDKKDELKDSPLKLNKQICGYKDWNVESIKDYQNYLADIAVKKWRIDDWK